MWFTFITTLLPFVIFLQDLTSYPKILSSLHSMG